MTAIGIIVYAVGMFLAGMTAQFHCLRTNQNFWNTPGPLGFMLFWPVGLIVAVGIWIPERLHDYFKKREARLLLAKTEIKSIPEKEGGYRKLPECIHCGRGQK
jgi:hypothetical protein